MCDHILTGNIVMGGLFWTTRRYLLSIFIMETAQIGCLLTGIVAQRWYTRHNGTGFILAAEQKQYRISSKIEQKTIVFQWFFVTVLRQKTKISFRVLFSKIKNVMSKCVMRYVS